MDYKLLKQTCLRTVESFSSEGTTWDTQDGILVYKECPDSKILGVAHLDSVLDLNHFHVVDVKKEDIVINAQLDDRLGVFTLLYLLPALGIKFDLLLTEGEEEGRSTAAYFEPPKKYNWIFSFDRRGDDVVLYQYESKKIVTSLKQAGFKIGQGSFSDIVFLDELGVKGFNVGTGYHGEHSSMCYANIGQLERQVKKFLRFYRENENTHFEHKYTSPKYSKLGKYSGYSNLFYDTGHYDDFYCAVCQKHPGKNLIGDKWVCDNCVGNVEECQLCHNLAYSDEVIDGMCQECIDALTDGED